MEKQNRLKRMRNATLAQIGITITSIGLGVATGNHAYTGEASHSGSDAATYGSRYLIEKTNLDQESPFIKGFLKLSLVVPAGIILYTSYRAGLDIYNNQIPEQHTVTNIAGALAIGGVNTYANIEMRKVNEHTHASSASRAHSDADMGFSWAIASGLAGEALIGRGVSNYVTAGAGVLAAGHLLEEAFKKHEH